MHTPEEALSVPHFLIPRGILYSVFTHRVSENVIFVPSFPNIGTESCLETVCAHPLPGAHSSFIITGGNFVVDFAKPFGACLGTERVFSKLINFVVIIKTLVKTEIWLSLQGCHSAPRTDRKRGLPLCSPPAPSSLNRLWMFEPQRVLISGSSDHHALINSHQLDSSSICAGISGTPPSN